MTKAELRKLEKVKELLEDIHLSNASERLAVENALLAIEWAIRNGRISNSDD